MGPTLLALAVQLALGAVVAGGLAGRRDLGLARFGLAWPAVAWSGGALAIAAAGAVLAALDRALVPGEWLTLAAVLALAIAVAALRLGGTARASDDAAPSGPHWPWWLFAVLWLGVSVDWIVLSNYLPIVAGDEASIWQAKAKVVYGLSGVAGDLSSLLPDGRLPGGRSHVHQAAYPWAASLLQAHVFSWHGEIVHYTSRVPLQVFAPCGVLALAEVARRSHAPVWWTLPLVAGVATTDMAFQALGYGLAQAAVIAGVTLLVVARYLGEPTRAWLSALALLLLVGTKPEGVAIAVAWVFAVLAVRLASDARPRIDLALALRTALVLAPSVAAVLVHQALNRAWGLEHHFAKAKPAEDRGLHFVETATNVVARHLFDWRTTHAVAGLALLAFLLAPARARRRPETLFAVVLWGAVAGAYALVLATSPYDVEWQWITAGPRIYSHVAPAAAAAGFALLARRPAASLEAPDA